VFIGHIIYIYRERERERPFQQWFDACNCFVHDTVSKQTVHIYIYIYISGGPSGHSRFRSFLFSPLRPPAKITSNINPQKTTQTVVLWRLWGPTDLRSRKPSCTKIRKTLIHTCAMFRACRPPRNHWFLNHSGIQIKKKRQQNTTTTQQTFKNTPRSRNCVQQLTSCSRACYRKRFQNRTLGLSLGLCGVFCCFRVLQDTNMTSKMVLGTSKIDAKL